VTVEQVVQYKLLTWCPQPKAMFFKFVRQTGQSCWTSHTDWIR